MTTLALFVGALPALQACPAAAGAPGQAGPPQTAVRNTAPQGNTSSHPGVPPALERLESAAEDIGDAVANGKWARANTLIQAAARDLDAVPQKVGGALLQAHSHLDETRKAIESRRSLDAQFAANALSGDVVDLYTGYQPVVPIEVMRLDVLLRRVQLVGLAGRPKDASAPLRETRTLWLQLHGQAPLASTPAALRFEGELNVVEQASGADDAEKLARAAGAALEGVDALEKEYERERPSR
jgi:hypothetical protein